MVDRRSLLFSGTALVAIAAAASRAVGSAQAQSYGQILSGNPIAGSLLGYSTSYGDPCAPYPLVNPSAPLLKGWSNVWQGYNVAISPDMDNTYCLGNGPGAMRDANHNYCCGGTGIQAGMLMVGCQYVWADGPDALKYHETGSNIAAFGPKAAIYNKSGEDIAAVGVWVLGSSTTAKRQAVLGNLGLYLTVAGAGHNFDDCAALGNDTRASGPGQIPIGGPSHTVYTSNPPQIRSDSRDKVPEGDLTEEEARIVIFGARKVRYRANHRERYIPAFVPPHKPELDEPVLVLPEEPVEPKRLPGISDAAWQAALDQHARARAEHPIRVEWVRALHVEAHALWVSHQAQLDREYAVALAEAKAAHELVVADAQRDRETAARAGTRIHHGVYADEEAKRLNDLGIDWAGVQHHAHDGVGEDVYSASYVARVPAIEVILEALDREIEALKRENVDLRRLMAAAVQERLKGKQV